MVVIACLLVCSLDLIVWVLVMHSLCLLTMWFTLLFVVIIWLFVLFAYLWTQLILLAATDYMVRMFGFILFVRSVWCCLFGFSNCTRNGGLLLIISGILRFVFVCCLDWLV